MGVKRNLAKGKYVLVYYMFPLSLNEGTTSCRFPDLAFFLKTVRILNTETTHINEETHKHKSKVFFLTPSFPISQ